MSDGMKRASVALLIAVGACVVWPAAAFGDGRAVEMQYTARWPVETLTLGQLQGYATLNLAEGEWLSEPGFPMLPVQTVRLAVPAGMRVTGVRVVDASAVDLPGEYLVQPAQPPRPISQPVAAGEWVGPDVTAYASSDSYPGTLAEVVHEADLAGQPIAYVRFCPVQYVPAARQLKFYTSISVVLEGTEGYVCGDYLSSHISAEGRARLEQMARDMVANPDDVMLQTEDASGTSRAVGPGDYDYVIVTSAAFAPSFQPLADWKTKKGVPAKVVDLDWIYANYTPTDNPTKIRWFMYDAYANWGTTFFLLGGDTGVVPYYVRTMSVPGYPADDIPNDTFYSDYDDDWVCEFSVGRAAVRFANLVGDYITKVTTYEKNPPLTDYAKTAAFFGFDLTDEGSAEGSDLKDAIHDLYLPAGWTYRSVFDNDAGDHKANVIAYLNQGNNLVNHADHGDNNSMGCGYTNHNWYLTNSDMDALTNGTRRSILYSTDCWVCDYPALTCIAEHFVQCSTGGGIAFCGNSRFGWYMPYTSDGVSSRYDRYFFRSLFTYNHYKLGDLFAHHKNTSYTNDQTMKYIFVELTLLGDPELPIWTENPLSLTVQHPATVTVGQSSSFAVQVNSGGSPVDLATVCLWKNGDVYQVALTAAGTVSFTVNPASTGAMYVTASKRNYLPVESSAQAVPDIILGDVNNDHAVDNFDINPFVAALTMGEAAFTAAHPTWRYWAADCNQNGVVDNFDINPFVDLLTGG